MELVDNLVYETTREIDTPELKLPAQTLVQYHEGEPYEFPDEFEVFDGPYKGLTTIWVEIVVDHGGLVEVIF